MNGSMDACRSERLFQHLANPLQALLEMKRVTRSGGWIVVIDTDWGTLSIDTNEVDIERRLVRMNAEQRHNNGYAGRQLYRLFNQCGLAEISIEMIPNYVTHYSILRQVTNLDKAEQLALSTGLLNSAELDCWHSELEQAEEEGIFFARISQVMARGKNPDQSIDQGASPCLKKSSNPSKGYLKPCS